MKQHDDEKPMNSKDELRSNDRKMKQDFPGYPHAPAGADNLGDKGNARAEKEHEAETTATGSESVRDTRPGNKENKVK